MSPSRTATIWALVAAPVLFLVDNLLHPTEYPAGNAARQLEEIAGSAGRWQVAHLLALPSILLFAVALVGLGALVAAGAPRLGRWGAALGVGGLIGLGAVLAIDGYTWGVIGEVSGRAGMDAATAEAIFTEVQESGWSLPYYLLPASWIAGMVVLAVGAARTRLAPPAAAAVLAAGAVMVGAETAIHDNAYFIASAAVLLAGCAAVAAALVRDRPA